MDTKHLDVDVLPKLRRAVERLEARYCDMLTNLTRGRESDQALFDHADDLRQAREAIEEARYAIQLCERMVQG
jgi:hypothetical protein